MIILKDIVLLADPGYWTQVPFVDYDKVFVDIFSGEDAANVVDKTSPPTLKIRRFGPLTIVQTPNGHVWVMSEPYEGPINVQFLNIAVSVSSPNSGDEPVDVIELDTNHIREISLSTDNSEDKPIFVPSKNAKLVLSVDCIYIPDDNQQSNAGNLSHAEYQLTLQRHKNGFNHLRSIGDHFTYRFERSSHRGDIDKAISYYENAVSLALGDVHLDDQFSSVGRLGSLFMRRFEHSGDLTDIEEAISHQEHAVFLTPDGHSNKPIYLNKLGNSFKRCFEHSGDLIHIKKAISHQEHAILLTPDGHSDKPAHLNNLGMSLLRCFEHSGDLIDIEKAISHHEHAVLLTPDGHSDKPAHLNNLGTSWTRCFEQSGDLIHIEKAILCYEHAILLTSDSHSDKPTHLNDLGMSLLRRFEQSGDLIDIDKAISHHEHAVLLTPDGHSDKPARLNNLGMSFSKHFDYSGDLIDIEKAISHYEHAVLLTPDGHSDKPAHLTNLGISLTSCFEHSGDLINIKKAISHYEHALHLIPDGHPDKPAYLTNLGISFTSYFEHSGDLVHIEKAISYHEDAILLTPDSHSDKPGRLNNLGNSFKRCFEHSGDLIDIDKAISHHEHASLLTPDSHSAKPAHLNNLGKLFTRRFEHSGDLIDIEKAISYHEQASLLIPDGNPDKPACLNNLGISFARRFEHSGDLIHIEKAISYHEYAILLTPDGQSYMPSRLNNLGNSFSSCSIYTGELFDIDKAISHHEHAVLLTPDGHLNKPTHLNSLGNSFLRRFEHSGDFIDIEKAISHYEHAVFLTTNGHSDKPTHLNNLGNAFSRRAEHSRDLIDIDKAISHHEHAVLLTPDGHSGKPARLNNLGSSFAKHFGHSGDLIDIEKAISHYEHALLLIPNGHSSRPTYLNNLGMSFTEHFEHSGDLINIEKAISQHEHAVLLTPDGHSDKPGYQYNLGHSFLHRFKHFAQSISTDNAFSQHEHAIHSTLGHKTFNNGMVHYLGPLGMSLLPHLPSTSEGMLDLKHAILSIKTCAQSTTGKPSILFNASLQWAQLAGLADISASLPGYQHALSLLPHIAWLGKPITTRFKHLASLGSISTEAAAAAIASNRPDFALEWLDQGHSFVWRQLLNLRTPVDDLSIVNPGLAANLVSTSRVLESAAMHDATSNGSTSKIQLSLEAAAQAHHRLAEKWDKLLQEVRMLPGFEDFLLPKRLSTLSKAASHGSIVVINVYYSQSDALILSPGCEDVVHIPLDSNLHDKAQVWQHSLNDELQAAGMGVRDARAGRLAHLEPNSSRFAKILAGLWTDVVKPILDGLAIHDPSSSDPPRIWWCPTGPLTFLPIHAAGIYTQSPPGPNLLDFAISSYTPTVTALLEASHDTPKPFKRLLGISQSDTPGMSRLPNADKELELIKQFIASPNVHSLQGESATVESVLNKMEEASWVHFACHAEQNGSSPLQSAFCLNDGPLTLSEIMKKSFPNADFAFLSACETATGDKNLPDEAVHLAAGMLAVGYRSVIATMWSIGDRDAPLIASEVYSHLTSGPNGPDSAKAAYALHHAVKRLRAQVGTDAFLSWVPYIHVGR